MKSKNELQTHDDKRIDNQLTVNGMVFSFDRKTLAKTLRVWAKDIELGKTIVSISIREEVST